MSRTIGAAIGGRCAGTHKVAHAKVRGALRPALALCVALPNRRLTPPRPFHLSASPKGRPTGQIELAELAADTAGMAKKPEPAKPLEHLTSSRRRLCG
jgi:hypothetical protein